MRSLLFLIRCLLLSHCSALDRISRENGTIDRVGPDGERCILIANAQHSLPRNALNEDALQFLWEIELLHGCSLHPQIEDCPRIREHHLSGLQEVAWMLRKRDLRNPELSEASTATFQVAPSRSIFEEI